MKPIRIQKYLADCGVASRRAAEKLIEEGRVTLEGRVAVFGDVVRPGEDTVTLDGAPVVMAARVYLLFNKPRGVISSASNEDERQTVSDYLAGVPERVFPVGFLGMDVEGAMLFTNDGDLAHAVNQPDCRIESTYIASVEGFVTDDTVARLRQGVYVRPNQGDLPSGPPMRARALVLHVGMRTSLIRIALRESREVSVSRLLDAINHPVCDLRRVAIENLHIGRLDPGEHRYLEEAELERFRRQVFGNGQLEPSRGVESH